MPRTKLRARCSLVAYCGFALMLAVEVEVFAGPTGVLAFVASMAIGSLIRTLWLGHLRDHYAIKKSEEKIRAI